MRGDAVGLLGMPGTCAVAVKMLKGKMHQSHYFVLSNYLITAIVDSVVCNMKCGEIAVFSSKCN